jgi:hypothetical protein
MSGFGTPEIVSSVSVLGCLLGFVSFFLVLAVWEVVPVAFLVSFLHYCKKAFLGRFLATF